MTSRVGIRALQQHASDTVRRVADGETVVITDRGRPVATLVPIRASGMEQLIASGLVREARRKLSELPEPLPAGGPLLSHLLAEQREDER